MPSKLVDKQLLYNGKKIRVEIHHLEDDDGGRFWLFRDGPYALAVNGQPTARWFLHGFCA